jgi:hypothetical protein
MAIRDISWTAMAGGQRASSRPKFRWLRELFQCAAQRKGEDEEISWMRLLVTGRWCWSRNRRQAETAAGSSCAHGRRCSGVGKVMKAGGGCAAWRCGGPGGTALLLGSTPMVEWAAKLRRRPNLIQLGWRRWPARSLRQRAPPAARGGREAAVVMRLGVAEPMMMLVCSGMAPSRWIEGTTGGRRSDLDRAAACVSNECVRELDWCKRKKQRLYLALYRPERGRRIDDRGGG